MFKVGVGYVAIATGQGIQVGDTVLRSMPWPSLTEGEWTINGRESSLKRVENGTWSPSTPFSVLRWSDKNWVGVLPN